MCRDLIFEIDRHLPTGARIPPNVMIAIAVPQELPTVLTQDTDDGRCEVVHSELGQGACRRLPARIILSRRKILCRRLLELGAVANVASLSITRIDHLSRYPYAIMRVSDKIDLQLLRPVCLILP